MKKYFVITIDVEPDCTPTWHYASPLTFEGVHVGIVKRLQPLFSRYGAIPTYLINNVVMEDEACINALRKLEGCAELGTHLHEEFIGPEKKITNYAGAKAEGNQCFLPPELEYAKLKSLTTLFKQAFGYDPTSFRAGRFSAGSNTIRSLIELGYRVDTSVTPGISWNDITRERPVDFRGAPHQPYFVSERSLVDPDPKGTLLEVPTSIFVQRYLWKKRTVWVRPCYASFEELHDAICKIERQWKGTLLVLNMMFHNVEVLPRLSPYTKTEHDCKVYLDTVERFLQFCIDRGFKAISLSGLYNVFARQRS